ncbi:hypothetical protein HD806DRAFT_406984 [Xylariaceae sp. AK1471]|nr:hypothetical protein HD806DRAFT_406984 [Xylariaceae sp. AK1471]
MALFKLLDHGYQHLPAVQPNPAPPFDCWYHAKSRKASGKTKRAAMAGSIRLPQGHSQYLAVLLPRVPLMPGNDEAFWPSGSLNPLPLGEEFALQKVLWENHVLEQQVAVLDARGIKRTSVGLYRIDQGCNGLAALANVITVAPGSLTPQEAEKIIPQL